MADDDFSPTMNYTLEGLDYYVDDSDPFVFHGRLLKPILYLLRIASPIIIFGGVFTNVLAFVVLVRGRLWLKHEGYVYLGANFWANIGILLFCSSSLWLLSLSDRYFPPNTSEFLCRFWYFMQSIAFAPGWLSVALLFNVYLREHLIHRRRCGCPMFASKYCTLFASKIIVGVVFAVVTVVALPYLAAVRMEPDFGCIGTEMYNHVLLAELFLMWGLPLVIFLVVILTILCTSREGRAFGFSQFEERSASDDQMRVTAAITSSMIFLSQFVLFVPYHIFQHYSITYEIIIALGHGLSIAIHPVLCFVILKALREGFLSQLRSILCCRRLFPSLECDEEAVRLGSIEEDPPSTSDS